MHTIGTCGLCAGPVKVPLVWPAMVQPVPKCDRCGAEANLPHGPLMMMRQPAASLAAKNLAAADALEAAARALRESVQ